MESISSNYSKKLMSETSTSVCCHKVPQSLAQTPPENFDIHATILTNVSTVLSQ